MAGNNSKHSPERISDLRAFLTQLSGEIAVIVGRLAPIEDKAGEVLTLGARRTRKDLPGFVRTLDVAVRDAVDDYQHGRKQPVKEPSLHSPDLNDSAPQKPATKKPAKRSK